MSGHRRAAVALHGLQATDRQWMLAELPEEDSRILRGYLDELDALGFSYGPEMSDDFQAVGTPLAAAASAAATASALPVAPAGSAAEQLRLASAAQMAACLQNEPCSLIASLLRLEAWPWQDALLPLLLPRARQQHLRALLEESGSSSPSSAKTAAKTAHFLCETLAARLRALPASAKPSMAATPPLAATNGQKANGLKKRGWLSFDTWMAPWTR